MFPYPEQSNTSNGHLLRETNEDLTAVKTRLVKLVDDNGTPKVELPDAITDQTPYLMLDVEDGNGFAPVAPLDPMQQYRMRLVGSCNAGDDVVMADPAVSADKGKVRALPAAANTYIQIGIAEEAGVDGQLLLVRPFRHGDQIVVT